MELYPELSLDERKFRALPHIFWKDKSVQKEFFNVLAEKLNFDPLDAHGWYKVTSQDVLKRKGGTRITSYFDNSHIKALLHVYPNLGLDPAKFQNSVEGS